MRRRHSASLLVPWLLALSLALVCIPARARPAGKRAPKDGEKDTTPPTMVHEPVRNHDGKTPIVIQVRIVDDKGEVFEPTLLVRAAGQSAEGDAQYRRLALLPSADDDELFTAVVPAELLVGDIEYLLEAFDDSGNGPARVGEEAAPLVVARRALAPVTPSVVPTATEGTEEEPSSLLIGGGIALGSILIVGAAFGVAVALYAARPVAPSAVRIVVDGPSPVSGGAP